MAVTVPASTWRALARRLADELDGDGDLRTPQWRDALLSVPRHEFVPRYYLPEPDARPLRWVAHEPRDAESTRRWLDLVYSPTTLITALADYVDRGVQAPVSSSTKPDLMIRMLEALEVADGQVAVTQLRVPDGSELRADKAGLDGYCGWNFRVTEITPLAVHPIEVQA